ncbi:MAG: hypothetical protein U0Q16_14750 [Bryobacteraceae bacterium]
MSIEIRLRGRISRGLFRRRVPDLRKVKEWIEFRCSGVLDEARVIAHEDGTASLGCLLHPAGESLTLETTLEHFLIADCRTQCVGPGYHIFVCELLRELASEFAIEWEPPGAGFGDSTGFFHNGDLDLVYQAMSDWLQNVATEILDHAALRESEGFGICMPLDSGFEQTDFVQTALGPRSTEWLEQMRVNRSRHDEFFAWWNIAQDALYNRNRALVLLCNHVRWRKPLTEAERQLLLEVDGLLWWALDKDPSLEFPWREWVELRQWAGLMVTSDRRLLEGASRIPDEEPLLGYRRHPVIVTLAAGWQLRVPGALADEWDDEGTWSGWDETHTIRVTTFAVNAAGSPVSAEELVSRQIGTVPADIRFELGGVHAIGGISERVEGSQTFLQLDAASAVKGKLAVLTATSTDLNEREWLMEVWRSLANDFPA